MLTCPECNSTNLYIEDQRVYGPFAYYCEGCSQVVYIDKPIKVRKVHNKEIEKKRLNKV